MLTLGFAPFFDGLVIAGQKHFWNALSFVLTRPRVLRVLQKPAFEAIVGDGAFVSDHSGKKPRDDIGEYHRGKFATGQDVIADGDFFVDTKLDKALVDAFVVSADDDEIVKARQLLGLLLREKPSLRRHQHGTHLGALGLRARGLPGAVKHIDFEEHPLTTAKRRVIGGTMFVGGEIADLSQIERDAATGLRFSKKA